MNKKTPKKRKKRMISNLAAMDFKILSESEGPEVATQIFHLAAAIENESEKIN